jgi:hypothetical protein
MCDVRFSLLISSDLGALFEISHLVHSSFSILDLVHGFVFPLVWILLRPSSWFASCSILTLGLGPHGAGARHFTGSSWVQVLLEIQSRQLVPLVFVSFFLLPPGPAPMASPAG